MKQNNPLWTRDFTIITIGSAVSILGNSIAGFAASLLVLDYTNSTFLYSLYVVVFNLPSIIMPLAAGPLLDRFSRKKAIYMLDFMSTGLYVLIYALLRLDMFNYTLFLFLSFVEGTIASIYNVAYDSFYPNLVSEGNFSKAYSISSLLYPLSALMAPVAAYIYAQVGLEPLFLINCFCFFIAACFEVTIKAEEKHVEHSAEHMSLSRFASDFRDGWKYLRSERGLLCIAVYFCVSNFSGGSEMVILPYFRSRPDLGVQIYSYVMAFAVAGRCVGGLVHYRFRYPVNKKFAIAMFVYVTLNFLTGSYLFMPVWGMIIALFLSGLFGVTSYNIRISATQSYIPDSCRARFNGIFSVITTVGMLSGQLISGAMGEVMPPRAVVVIFAVIGFAGCIIMVRGRKDVSLIYNREV